jgi:predicted XRE-type DNA-binding protein
MGDWEMTKTKVYGNVWDAIEPDPAKTENLKLRSALMSALIRHIKREGWTQAQAAKILGVTQPRISNLIHGKIDEPTKRGQDPPPLPLFSRILMK